MQDQAGGGRNSSLPPPEPIAVLGYSVVLPTADSGEKLFELVKEKRQVAAHRDDVNFPLPTIHDSIQSGSVWKYRPLRGNYFRWEDAIGVDRRLLRIPKKDTQFMSILQCRCLDAVWRAVEDAGLRMEDLHRTRTGIFVGAYDRIRDYEEVSDETGLRSTLMSSMADRIGYFLGTHGPSMTLDTACSSSLTALAMAVASLRKGDCDIAIVATVQVRSTHKYLLNLQAAGVLSDSGYSRPFDEEADGMGRAEGWGCVLLQRVTDAEREGNNITATIVNASCGAAGAVDDATEGAGRAYEATCPVGIYNLLTNCCQQASIPLEHVRYVEAHATGTSVGDLAELQGIARTFRSSHDINTNPLRVASIKGNIGHAETAAGLFSLVKVVEMLRHRVFLPTGGLTKARSDFDWKANNIVPMWECEPFPADDRPVYIGVNSFGIGGAYVHAVLTEYKKKTPTVALTPYRSITPAAAPVLSHYLLPLSAVSEEHLTLYEQSLADYLEASDMRGSVRDICGTFAVNRSLLKCRRVYVTSSVEDLVDQLRKPNKEPVATIEGGGASAGGVAMVFTGQGAQWLGCGEQLMQLPVYRRTVEAIDNIFRRLAGWSLRDRMALLTEDDLMQTQYAQPVTFMVQIGLFELLKSFGIAPSVVLGHSAGEVPAAYAAGLLSLEEAVGVVYHRSQEQQKLAGSGRMLAVGLSESAARQLLTGSTKEDQKVLKGVEVACVNSPQSVVLAGTIQALEAVKSLLPPGTPCTFVPGNIAFHCALTEPILPELTKRLSFLDNTGRGRRGAGSSVPFISTVSGQVHQGPTDAAYWAANVREAVRFQQAVELLTHVSPAPSAVLEIGPHRTLIGPLLQSLRAVGQLESIPALPTLRRKTDDLASFLGCMGQLVLHGLHDSRRLHEWYRTKSGYTLLGGLPKHPRIHTPFRPISQEQYYTRSFYESDIKGPFAGDRMGLHGVGITKIEVSEGACPQMMEHCIGGTPILPGAYYLEAVVEASGGVPCVLVDTEFLNRCVIPKSGEDPTVLSTALQAEPGGCADEAYSFKVRSSSVSQATWLGGANDEDKTVLHCEGKVLRHSGLVNEEDGSLCIDPTMPTSPGLDLRDIGRQGLAEARARHPLVVAASAKDVYSVVNRDAKNAFYGPSFQLLQEMHMDATNNNFFGHIRIEDPLPANYTPQLIDACLHVTSLWPALEPTVVAYFGGIDVAYFLRAPKTKDIYFVLNRKTDDSRKMGRVITLEDLHVYDTEGHLLFAWGCTKSIWGGDKSTMNPCELTWQPYLATTDDSCLRALQAGVDPVSTDASIAEVIKSIGLDKRARAAATAKARQGDDTPQVLVRVLECVEDEEASGTVLRALSSPELGEGLEGSGVIVEVYSTTHNQSLLDKINIKVPAGAASYLRVRRALLPAALDDLRFFAFDCLVVGSWGRAWGGDDMMSTLRSMACPGALLLFHGGNDHKGVESIQLLQAALGSPATTLLKNGEEPVLLSTRLTDVGSAEASTTTTGVLVVGESRNVAEQMSSRLPASSSSHVLVIGPDQEVKEEAIRPYLVKSSKSQQQQVDTIVFLGGILDQGPLSANGYYSLLSLFRAVNAVREAGGNNNNGSRPLDVWVVTMGCFFGETINVGQGSLYSITRQIEQEVPGLVNVRYADLAGVQCMPHLAKLVASRPAERNFCIAAAGDVLVQRYFALEQEDLNAMQVPADDDKLAYHAEVYRVEEAPVKGQVCVKFRAEARVPPADNEVTVQVKASGLNFRDVMLAISMLPVASLTGSAFGKRLGMEATGVVVAVGKHVTNVKVGDRVLTTEPNSFASFQNVEASRTFKLPDGMSFETGATTTSVYNTAHHGLINLARVRKGERVLVHAAAGGVGQAAISICQFLGAEVYATTSKAKRAVVEAMGVDPARIFDSRATTWFTDIMAATKGKGVHVVLNSLAGKHQRLGIEALAPNGRFLEIGKMDIYKNTAIGQTSLCKNGSFFAIDMDRLALDDPELTAEITEEVFARLSSGKYKAVPHTAFPMDRIKEAMEFMRSGKHIGKIALVNQVEDGKAVTVKAKRPVDIFRPDGLYLVTGGAGGFGSRIVRSAATLGAKHIVVTVSRDPSRVQQLFGDLIKQYGVRIDAVVADLSKEQDVTKVVDYCRTQALPLRGIYHSAGFSLDSLLAEVKRGDLEYLAAPKNLAAMWLHNKTLDMQPPLETFAVVSSSSADSSGPRMLLYSATNAMLNAFVRYRRSLGLPACALNMCSLLDVGILANDVRAREAQMILGLEFITSKRAMRDLTDVVMSGKDALVEMQLRHDSLCYGSNRVSLVHNIRDAFVLGASSSERVSSPEEVLEFVVEAFKAITKDPDVQPKAQIASLGFDSLGFVELAGRVKAGVGVDLPISQIGMTATVEEVSQIVITQLRAKGSGGDDAVAAASTQHDDGSTPETAAEGAEQQQQQQFTISAAGGRRNVRSLFEEEEEEEVEEEDAENCSLGSEEGDSHGSTSASSDGGMLHKGKGDLATSRSLVPVPSCAPVSAWRRGRSQRLSAAIARPEVSREEEPMSLAEAEKWLKVLWKAPDPRKKLVVIPSAAASTDPFKMLSLQYADIIAVQIPGRPGRENEEPIFEVELLGRKVAQAMEKMGLLEGAPIVIMGHSGGAPIGFEAILYMKKQYGYTPERLMPNGIAPPQNIWPFQVFGNRYVVAFFLYLAGGSKRFAFHKAEEAKLVEGVVRDVKAIHQWSWRQDMRSRKWGEKIDCPLTFLGGRGDALLLGHDLTGWQRYTSGGLSIKMFPGDHYFITDPKSGPEVSKYFDSLFAPKA